MKKTLKYTGLIIGLSIMLIMNACEEKISPVVEELEFERAFTPIGLSALVGNVTTVNLNWTVVSNTDHYVLEIYEGTEFGPASLVHTAEIDGEISSFSFVLPAGDTQFTARLKAISALDGVDDSKWNTIGFKTAPENLFGGYESLMTGPGSCTVRWKPGETATALMFHTATSDTPYTLTTGEIAAGEKVLTGVPSGKYEIRLMNGTFVRGRIKLVIEGDVVLASGGDLNAALNALPAGGVLILENGGSYALSMPDTVDASVKIRAVYPDNLPVIFLETGGGYHMFDIGAGMTMADSLVFENVAISCAYDDNPATKHRGVIDQEASAFTIGRIRFINSVIRNSGRSIIRLRGGSNVQTIGLVEFNNCVMYDFAFDSHYGVLNGASNGNFNNIRFINSTAWNLRGGIINYTAGAGCESVVVDKCTFNMTTMDASTARTFIDFGTANTSAGTITVSDCVFGQTGATANGIRNNAMSLTMTGSYYTADFVSVSYPITTLMTAYPGSSSALWTDPANGNFTFADPVFPGKETAGDPRWKP